MFSVGQEGLARAPSTLQLERGKLVNALIEIAQPPGRKTGKIPIWITDRHILQLRRNAFVFCSDAFQGFFLLNLQKLLPSNILQFRAFLLDVLESWDNLVPTDTQAPLGFPGLGGAKVLYRFLCSHLGELKSQRQVAVIQALSSGNCSIIQVHNSGKILKQSKVLALPSHRHLVLCLIFPSFACGNVDPLM